MTVTQYKKGPYLQREFMRPIGELRFHFISRALRPVQSYLTIISPFDNYVWTLLSSSVIAITLTLIIADMSYAKWTNTSMKGVFHHSMLNSYQMDYITVDRLSLQTSSLELVQLLMRLLWINIFARALVQRPEKLSFLRGYYWDL